MTFNEFLPKYKALEKPASTLYHKYFSKNGAKVASFIFISLGITPNAVSLMSFLLLIVSCLLLISGEFFLIVLSVLLLQVSYVFDCSDGIVARYSGLSSSFGAYLDVLLDRVGGALFMLSVFYCSIILFELENPALVGFSLLVCFFYHLSSSFRPYYFPQLKGYMKSGSKVTLPKLFVKFSYEFIDTGIFYLILSTGILASVIEPVAYFYGVIGSLLLVGNMVVLYRADNNG